MKHLVEIRRAESALARGQTEKANWKTSRLWAKIRGDTNVAKRFNYDFADSRLSSFFADATECKSVDLS